VSAVVDVAAARSEAAEARQAAQAASAAAVQIESNARQAQVQADSARSDAQQARGQADTARSQAEQAQIDASEARSREEEARAEALEARANEAAARAEADEARLQAEQARHDAEMMRQALDASVAQILEARREARGLIVNISDVLFDFNEATLTPGAKSRIQKLAEILTSYAGPYHVDIEGHTDSAGPDDINLRLSEARAQSVRTALLAAGIPSERVGPAHGVGKDTPVATNGTATGRQFNRRVEIIVGDGNK
jgi:outer membrane protein OmpA-like peptidoglycan-associated protein